MQQSLSPVVTTLAKFNTFLVTPAQSVPTNQKRNARLIAWLTITLAVGTFLAILVSPTNVAAYIGGASFFVAYLLSRTPYFRFGVYIIVFGFGSLPYLFTMVSKSPITAEALAVRYMWLILPMLVASAILPLRQNLFVVAVFFFALLFMPLYAPSVTFGLAAEATSLVGITGGLILVFMNHRSLLEQDRRAELSVANQALRQSEASLEKRVEERTRALDIALKQAEEANIVKSQFLASTSHELRTPLNAIINFGEFLQQGILGEINDDQAEASENIISSGRHLLALINDVLDISKIEAGALQLYVEDNVNLNNELTDLLKTATTLLKDSPVKAVLDVPEPLPLVRGDRIRIRQIMLNLISNACKFTEQGTVTVRAIRQDSDVFMSVTDTGPGIQAADFDKIFETFRQTEVGIRKGKGTGLGLPIARRLAEAHGGLLTVESIIGQGAAFTVRLPIKSDNLILSNVES